jgi:hypothetical protein
VTTPSETLVGTERDGGGDHLFAKTSLSTGAYDAPTYDGRIGVRLCPLLVGASDAFALHGSVSNSFLASVTSFDRFTTPTNRPAKMVRSHCQLIAGLGASAGVTRQWPRSSTANIQNSTTGRLRRPEAELAVHTAQLARLMAEEAR